MTVRNLYGVSGTLALAASAVATIIRVDSTLSGAIVASGFVDGADETYFAITAGDTYEVVKVTAVNGQDLTVVRGIGDTIGEAFPIGSELAFVITAEGIIAAIGPIVSTVQITGSGLAEVDNPVGNEWTIDVPAPNFTYGGGLTIQGTYPDMEFTYTAPDCCGDDAGGGGTGISSIQTSGIISASVVGALAALSVPAPAFTGSGVTITGVWPNLVFTVTVGGGTGTVTSVTAGAGITVTGAPTITPTVGITNTGVVAGTYGGIVINARGQISAVPATLNPVSILVNGTGISIARVGDSATINVVNGAIGTKGAVEFVDHTDPYDPLITDQALTPAALAAALATVSAGTGAGVNLYAGEAPGVYTNTIGASATLVDLAAGQKAIVHVEVTMVDTVTPLVPVNFGLGVIDGAASIVKADRDVTQSKQSMTFIVTGPVSSTSWSIVTTAVPGGATVASYSMTVTKFPA